MENYREHVRRVVLQDPEFVELTLSGRVRSPWRRITIRPVLVRGRRCLQFSRLDTRQDFTSNYALEDAAEQLDEALEAPFSSIRLRSAGEYLELQITKKGRAIVHRRESTAVPTYPDLSHDRHKELPLPAGSDDPVLRALGITDSEGRVRPRMAAKLSQVNELIKLLEHSEAISSPPDRPLAVVDCGCGSAYLTFGVYHYLNDVRRIPASLLGLDVNEKLIAKCRGYAEELGYDRVRFEVSEIGAYRPDERPDVVLALHACDTATDEAIAQAIRWEARLLMCVPCCHHYLNDKIRSDVHAPVLRHGILRERTADVLTDAFRALVLRIMGYRAEVVEFVSTEHTARNLMIRAVRGLAPGERRFVREYLELKRFWGVTPYLEVLLGEDLARHLREAEPRQ